MRFETGLTDAEIEETQSRFGFTFPPDLRRLLQDRLPVADDMPNWRTGPFDYIENRLAWPVEGVLFDVEHAEFWWERWGGRPKQLDAAIELARAELVGAPPLIPLRGHQYLPSVPCAAGNPILAAYQTDIIVMYRNLDHFTREVIESGLKDNQVFDSPENEVITLRGVPIWGALAFFRITYSQPYWDPGLQITNPGTPDPRWDQLQADIEARN